jgi:hypothetical protein
MTKEPIMVFAAILAASLLFMSPSIILSKAPMAADMLQFISYPWGANQTIPRPQNALSSDPITQSYVYFSFARAMLRNGQLPLWTPYTYAGAPFIGNPQSAVFYPYSLFVYVLPLNSGIVLFIVANLVTAGFGMYLLLRRSFTLRLFPSLFGAYSWMFSGSVMAFLYYRNSSVIVWWPLVMLFAHRLAIKGKAADVAYLALAMSASILGGHAEVTAVLVPFITAYFLVLLLMRRQRQESLTSLLNNVAKFMVAGGLAIGIASIQLLPALEYAQSSYRLFLLDSAAAHGSSFALNSTIDLSCLPALLYPTIFTSPLFNYEYVFGWMNRTYAAYPGIIAIALVPVGLFYRRRDARMWFFSAASLLSLWYAFRWPFAPASIYLLPLFSNVNPGCFFHVACLCTIIAASVSVEAIVSRSEMNRHGVSRVLFFTLVSFYAISSTVIALVVSDAFLRSKVDSLPSMILPLKVFPTLSFGAYLAFVGIEVAISIAILTAGICVMCRLARVGKKKLTAILLRTMLIALVLCNLIFYAAPFNSQSDASFVYPASDLVSFLTDSAGTYRIAQVGNELVLNSPMYFKIQSVAGYDAMAPATYGQLVSQSPEFYASLWGGVTRLRGLESSFFDLMGVRYFVLAPDSPSLPEGYHVPLTMGTSSLASSQVIAELHSGTRIGQSFVAEYQNLTEISVELATDGRIFTPQAGFTFISVREGIDGPVLRTAGVSNTKVTGDFWFNFTFPPIRESERKTFSLWLTSNSSMGQGLLPWSYPVSNSTCTQLFVNSTAVSGSLVYKTYYMTGTPTDLTLVYSGNDGKVYRNNLAQPRAFMVYRYVSISDNPQILRLLNSSGFDFRNTLVLRERIEPFAMQSAAQQDNSVKITDYTPNHVTVRVKTPSAGFLVLTDQYYPGWLASVNGKETTIYQADYAFRAVLVQAGESTVTFDYSPRSFIVGAYVTFAALLSCAILFAYSRYRDARKRDTIINSDVYS